MTHKLSILLVEDEKNICDFISASLSAQDYRISTAHTGKEALPIITSQCPDLILLDLGLPDMDGVDVILKIRSWTNTPIIVISARSEDSDKIAALDAGADDYLTKPFSVDELLARLRSTQRRLSYMQSLEEVQTSLFANGGLTIDYAAGCACLDGEELHLTPYEYKLLCLLAHNVGKVLTHSYITREIWGAAWEGDVASLRVFMASLRKRLKNPSQPQYIQTTWEWVTG